MNFKERIISFEIQLKKNRYLLRQFRLLLLNDIRKIMETKNVEESKTKVNWKIFPSMAKSQEVTKMMVKKCLMNLFNNYFNTKI